MSLLTIQNKLIISNKLNFVKTSLDIIDYNLVKKNSYTSTNVVATDRFGEGLVISPDGSFFVSSPKATINDIANAGAVYHFVKNGTTYVQTQQIDLGANSVSGSEYGSILANTNDWLVVSAYNEKIDTARNAGAVYLYKKNNNAVIANTVIKLTSPTMAADNNFGYWVDIYGTTLVVGEPKGDTNVRNGGSVHIYDYDGQNWNLTTSLDAGQYSVASANYGSCVSLFGDLLAVGAPNENSGAVYLYERNASVWSLKTKITPSLPLAASSFGFSLKLKDTRLVVGSTLPGNTKGRVYYYENSNNVWAQQQILTVDVASNDPIIIDNIANASMLGWSVDIHSTRNIIIASAPYAYNNQGRVYVFEKRGSTWGGAVSSILSENTSQFFGWTFGFNGDDLIVGERKTDNTVGYVYYYSPQP